MSSFSALTKFVTLAAIASAVRAHVMMEKPGPINSKFDPSATSVDSDYTKPLPLTGDGYPCKGYQNITGKAVDTLNAGSNYQVKLAGSAIHGGGSCQFSVSYDNGATWGVIHQIIGNCPTENASYDFPIPKDLPSSQGALFAWTWYGKMGGLPELYMNCARVDIMGSNTGALELPKMFVANVFGGGTCTVAPGTDIDFNNPTLNNCTPDKLVTPDQKVTVGSGTPAPPSTPPPPPPPGGEDPCPEENPSTPPTPPATPPPATGGAGAWAADKVYVGGDSACVDGKSFKAKWWTMGEKPPAEVWAAGGAC